MTTPGKQPTTPKIRKNEEIRAPEIRVISEEGGQLGVMDVKSALKIAEQEGLDLVEISPTATPPVCKLIDYGKFLYQIKKKQAEAKKKQTVVQVKEVKFRPITEEHDMLIKVRNIERFLAEGNKAKCTIRFKGREIVHADLGREASDKIMQLLQDHAVVEQAPKMEGRQLIFVLAPKKKS